RDSVLFFFFQAEDGIRDFHVTGVQTCALPISRRKQRSSPLRPTSPTRLLFRRGFFRSNLESPLHARCAPPAHSRFRRRLHSRPRSEERRVGKECSSRWQAEG